MVGAGTVKSQMPQLRANTCGISICRAQVWGGWKRNTKAYARPVLRLHTQSPMHAFGIAPLVDKSGVAGTRVHHYRHVPNHATWPLVFADLGVMGREACRMMPPMPTSLL